MDCVNQTKEQIRHDDQVRRLVVKVTRLRNALAEALGDLGYRGTVDDWLEEVGCDD
jgi:hypothetical protein